MTHRPFETVPGVIRAKEPAIPEPFGTLDRRRRRSGHRTRRGAPLAAVALALTLAPATAHAVLLGDLFNGGSIIIEDKLFSDFQIEFDLGSVAVDPFSIDVTGLADDPGTSLLDPGLAFTALNDALTVDNGDFIDFSFNFKATVLTPHLDIAGASLALTDFVLDPASDGLIQIDDFVFDPTPAGLGTAMVQADAQFFDPGDLTDLIEFKKENMVFQEITIFVDSGFVGAPTGIIVFEARKVQIAEPATLGVFGVGLAGLALWRRRQRETRR